MTKIINLWEECARRTGYEHPVFVPHEQEENVFDENIIDNPPQSFIEEQERYYEHHYTMASIERFCEVLKHLYGRVPDLDMETKNFMKWVNGSVLDRINELSNRVIELETAVSKLDKVEQNSAKGGEHEKK